MEQPTDEASAQIASATRAEKSITMSNRTMVISAIAASVIVVASVIGFGANLNSQVGEIGHLQQQIRQTQIINTARSDCQNDAFKDVLADAKLAFDGDKNPADYKTAPKCK